MALPALLVLVGGLERVVPQVFEAFAGCTGLTRVTLPQSVGTLAVGKNAFDAATVIEIEGGDGYVFCGWTNATGNTLRGQTPRTRQISYEP